MAYSGPGQVLYNGRVVLQAQNAEFDGASGNNDVTTLALGRNGHTPGAKKITLAVSNAIPDTGFEVDWVGIWNAQVEIALGFKIGTTTFQLRGDLREVKIGTDTDAANKISWTFHGIITAIF